MAISRARYALLALAAFFISHLNWRLGPAWPEDLGTCPVFPSDNVWNTPVDQLPVDPNSAAYIDTVGRSRPLRADFGAGFLWRRDFGLPFMTIPGNLPRVDITFEYAEASDPSPYPIPPDAPIEGGRRSKGDRHILLVDRDHCLLYELFDAAPDQDGGWQAGSGAIFDLRSNRLRPAGWTSADGAGMPIFPGLVRYDEVMSGEIRHALRFTVPQTRGAYIWPARHQASHLSQTRFPPMGQRFRLRADFDESALSKEARVIARALKRYGMFLSDNGAPWFVSGVPDNRWRRSALADLRRIRGGDLQAVDESSLMVDPNSAQARPMVNAVR